MNDILKVNEQTFDMEMYNFYDTVRESALGVINEWIKKGYLDDKGVKKLVEHLDDNLNNLLPDKI